MEPKQWHWLLALKIKYGIELFVFDEVVLALKQLLTLQNYIILFQIFWYFDVF